jgi:hypothetical protein
MSKKESKIENLQNTLHSLNKNRAELTKGESETHFTEVDSKKELIK